jgi:hypothetical protein
MAISEQRNAPLDPRRPFRVAGGGVFRAARVVEDNHGKADAAAGSGGSWVSKALRFRCVPTL